MMKKLALIGMGVCIALACTSCKSKESAYKKAYEKAKQKELAEVQPEAPAEESAPVVSAPVVAVPVEKPRVVTSAPAADVRQEKVTVVAGAGNGLLDYSVVCGSFGVKANAENLKAYLDAEGYSALVVFNAEKAMYRVIVSTFADRASAAAAKEQFKARYPHRKDFQGSWLLYRIN